MNTIKKYIIWSVLLSALIGLNGCGNSSSEVASDAASDVATASDFSMTLDVEESTVEGNWKTLSSVGGDDPLSASVVTQGSYGNFTLEDDSITYTKTAETNETDTGVLEISGGTDTIQITVTVHSLYWKQISEGEGHTSAIKSDGTLWSWGSNAYGQLGDGTTTSSLVPVQEETEASDWISVRAGSGYSIGKKQNQEKRRWGKRNTVPIANDQSVVTDENVATAITLTGSDADNDPLTYIVVSSPSNGTLTGTAPNLTYTPDTDYSGADSFTFIVTDGTVDSAPATVSIMVNAVVDNTPPVANDQAVVTDENVAKAITLTGSDADGDPLTYTVVSDPTNGTLTGTAPNLTYTPDTDYSGADSFTFIVNDGTVDSAPAIVSITVDSVNASDVVLTQIGLEADTPDTVNSVVTVAQLNLILPALTDVTVANETAYQDYIDENPDLFSSPATQAEVQAMIDALADVDVNIALNKTVTPLTNTVLGEPQNIVDGNLTSLWYSYEYQDVGWVLSFTIDLEEIYTIKRYRFWAMQTRRYRIESSLDGVNWTIRHDVSGVDYYSPGIQDINVTSPYQMRYVRYWAINYDIAYTGMAEFEVYGELVP